MLNWVLILVLLAVAVGFILWRLCLPNQCKGRTNAVGELTAEEAQQEVASFIAGQLAEGFSSREEIIEYAENLVANEYPGLVEREQIVEIIEEALAERRREEAQWKESTDCDRLDTVFSALECSGIIARQNFTCCQSCGRAEMEEEIKKGQEAGEEIRGWTFYHAQDTDSAVDGGGLHLAFGAVHDDAEDAIEIGNEIVGQLRAAGLGAEWDGNPEKRIYVAMEWKKRRCTDAPTV